MQYQPFVVKIKFRSKQGFGLWISLEDNNLLLSSQTNVILFPKLLDLEKFVLDKNQCNFDDLSGYLDLHSSAIPILSSRTFDYFNVDNAMQSLSHPSQIKTGKVLDCLNMLDDMLFTAYKQRISHQNHETKHLSVFLDKLTSSGTEDGFSHEDLVKVNQEIENVAERVSKKVLLVKKL
jgi:hypothetical protein